jgi:hypothetical protein
MNRGVVCLNLWEFRLIHLSNLFSQVSDSNRYIEVTLILLRQFFKELYYNISKTFYTSQVSWFFFFKKWGDSTTHPITNPH